MVASVERRLGTESLLSRLEFRNASDAREKNREFDARLTRANRLRHAIEARWSAGRNDAPQQNRTQRDFLGRINRIIADLLRIQYCDTTFYLAKNGLRLGRISMDNMSKVNRRDFLNTLGVTVGGTGLAGAGLLAGPRWVRAATVAPKGKIPDTPFKTGHMTFLTGPAAVLGEPSLKGHILAAEEINAKGGLLGKRKIETVKADEAAGTDANVKELRRMKLDGKIDLFTGVISSGNSPALGPVAEELEVLTLLTDGCTDFLFDKAVPNPKYVFRVTNIQSADGITAAIGAAQAWPQVRKIAHIHPDYSYGRNAFEHFTLAIQRLLPGTEIVAESWPKLGTTDFTAHITKTMSAQPDLLFTGVWGGDYVAFYKQALRYGLFDKMKVATSVAFGVAPHAIGKDHPEGVLAGAHANYYFTYPGGNRWPENSTFVQKYFKRWNEYPNFESEGAYVA